MKEVNDMVAFFIGALVGGGIVYLVQKKFKADTSSPDELEIKRLREENQAITDELDGAIDAREKALKQVAELTDREMARMTEDALKQAKEAPIGITYISEDEYNELLESGTVESEAIEYYTEDPVFVDSIGEVIANPGDLFGNDIYHTMAKNEVVYIQDHDKGVIYEITSTHGNYARDFLGIPDVDDSEDA